MIYLYLAKRDRKSVKILSLFEGECPATRLQGVGSLQLPWEIEAELSAAADMFENAELWMESASDFHELRDLLKARGFSGIPSTSEPLVWLNHVEAEVNHKEGLVRRGKRAYRLAPDVLARLRHRAKMARYNK